MFGRLGYDGQWRHNGLVSGAAGLIKTAKAADSPSRGWRAPWWAWPGPWWAGSTRGSGRRGRGRGRGRGSCRRGSRATARCLGTPAPPAQGQQFDFVLFQILFRLVVFRYLLPCTSGPARAGTSWRGCRGRARRLAPSPSPRPPP